MAYVEVKAKTVEMAIEAAMRELGVTDRERLEIEVLQEPERGFLGLGGQDAIVKVAEREGAGKRSRGRKRSRSKGKGGGNQREAQPKEAEKGRNQAGKQESAGRGGKGGGPRKQEDGRSSEGGKSGKDDDRTALDVQAQEPLARQFLQGLLETLGLEGDVQTRVEDGVIVVNVVGEQTEALVGSRGAVMEAVHELTKTVLQRSAQEAARVRIDIAGYAERRRQALTIYAGELIGQVLSEGGELMLEPMSASDRKVIHDAVAERSGVRSYSEGEAPGRYVVIAAEGDEEESGRDPEE